MVYLINVGLMLFWDIVIPENARGKRKALCVLYCLQWILLSGLRAYTVGADTFAYKIYHFDVTYATPWNRLFPSFPSTCMVAAESRIPVTPFSKKSAKSLLEIIIRCIF